MSAPPLRVLIAEDNDDLRELLVTLVSAEPDLKCVGTANDVDAVIASTAEHKADVLVLDLELQGRSSIDVLQDRAPQRQQDHHRRFLRARASGDDSPHAGRRRRRLCAEERRLRAAARRDSRQARRTAALTPGRASEPARQRLHQNLEPPGAGQPQRIGVIQSFEIELLVLEADVELLADVGADARAVHEVLGLLVELDAVVELRLPRRRVAS